MWNKIRKWFKPKQYVTIQDIIVSYNPSTQQVGVRKGALDAENMARFMKGERFEFNGSVNPFVTIPKPRKDNE